MITENLYEPFSVSVEMLNEYQQRDHTHTFFELVYILEGTGRQCINNSKFSYNAGHMFLITPQDCHSFEIDTPTQFFFLRFSNYFINQNSIQLENCKHLEFILQNANHRPGCILRNQTDKSLVKPVIEAIIREYINHDIYNKELVSQLVNTLIIVVARNIAKFIPSGVNNSAERKILDILQYIQNNIYTPEKIRSEAICRQFGISENYLSRYFKKNTNETLQDYINKYKTKIIEHRLTYSEMRIKEIVDEIGFTDESHLNKFFKKQKGISPALYRKSSRSIKIN